MSGERVLAGKTKWRSEQPVIGSRITWRILAINIFALAVLVVGLLYVGKYRQELIESEIKSPTVGTNSEPSVSIVII